MGTLSRRGPFLLIAILFAVLVGERVSNFIVSERDPYTFMGTWAKPDQVHAGDTLNVYYHFERHFYCQTDLNRFIETDDETHAIVWRDRALGGATGLGVFTVLNPVKLPDEMTPGPYLHRVITYSQCPHGVHVIPWPDVRFTVIP